MPARAYTLSGADGRPYPSTVPGALGGKRSTRISGRLDCPTALRHIAGGGSVANRVFFPDAADARAAGYRPRATGGAGPRRTRAVSSRR